VVVQDAGHSRALMALSRPFSGRVSSDSWGVGKLKALGEFEVWFLTGSQDLYGEETLRQGGAELRADR